MTKMHSEDTRTGIFLPHVSILGNHHCGKERCEEFKLWGNLHDFLCRLDYAKRVVSSFSHQIQSEYYGRNIYVSIEGISLEHFSASHHPIPLLASYHVSRQEVFNYFFLMTENRMSQPQLNTVNALLDCCKT